MDQVLIMQWLMWTRDRVLNTHTNLTVILSSFLIMNHLERILFYLQISSIKIEGIKLKNAGFPWDNSKRKLGLSFFLPSLFSVDHTECHPDISIGFHQIWMWWLTYKANLFLAFLFTKIAAFHSLQFLFVIMWLHNSSISSRCLDINYMGFFSLNFDL